MSRTTCFQMDLLPTTAFGCACELHNQNVYADVRVRYINGGHWAGSCASFYGPVWDRFTQIISEKSQIIPPNALLIILLFWNATAKKSTPTLRFETRLAPRFSQNATLSPCSPSVLSSPPDPDLDRASLPPVASCLLRRPALSAAVSGRLPPASLPAAHAAQLRRPASLLCPPACSTSSRAPPGPQQGPPGAQQSSASLLCSLLLPAVAAWSEDPKKPRHVPQASRQQRPVIPQASRQRCPLLPPC